MMNRITLLFLSAICFTLSACGGDVQETLGLKKSAPDEFAVIKRAPLAMPPDYNLRPPRPGAPRPQEQTTSQEARQTVFGSEDRQAAPRKTDGESLLLEQAGGYESDPNIRTVVDSETAKLHDRNKPVAEKLLGLGGDKDEPSATVVDAEAEAERLRKNLEEGQPVTEGETPSIEE